MIQDRADPALIGTGLEELLRWASPVNHMLRYATRDVVIRDTPIAAGDAVVVWLGSANRDEDEFPDSESFDIRRKPNKHLAFGIGPHYCIGHSVARVTLKILFEELLTRWPHYEPAGPIERDAEPTPRSSRPQASRVVGAADRSDRSARPRRGARRPARRPRSSRSSRP